VNILGFASIPVSLAPLTATVREYEENMKTITKNLVGGLICLTVFVIIAQVSGWLPLNLIMGPQYEKENIEKGPKPANAQPIWWLSEYPKLVQKIDNSPSKQLETSYRTGPEGQSKVNLKLIRSGNDIVLEVMLPKQAIVYYDKENNAMVPSSEPQKIIMRDLDQDGVLDNFLMLPGTPSSGTSLTTDGFIKFEPKEEYQGIFIHWVVGIGYSINHFLHDLDSAIPRKPIK